MSSKKFHNLARAVIVKSDHILVAHEIGAANTFLPGGHIEIGESVEATLIREVFEEIGQKAVIGKYLGAVEYVWDDSNGSNFEMNHLFTLDVPGISPQENPRSNEKHLEFYWVKLRELRNHNLLPEKIKKLLVENDINSINALWASDINR
jgi:8-oxo-dGTP diphosphatase